VLAANRDQLDRVATALLERETLSLEELERIAGLSGAGAPASR
jgi:ATP-dependent Zn protease